MTKPTSRPGFDGAAKGETLQRFYASKPETPHTIADTLQYLKAQNAKPHPDPDQYRQAVFEYATAFAGKSAVLRELDESVPPIMRTVRAETFPNVIVELARLIPKDNDGSTQTRVKFLAAQLSRSETFAVHFTEYNRDKLPTELINEASVVWNLHRAFRSLDSAGQTSLVFELGKVLPIKHATLMLADIHQDFHAGGQKYGAVSPVADRAPA